MPAKLIIMILAPGRFQRHIANLLLTGQIQAGILALIGVAPSPAQPSLSLWPHEAFLMPQAGLDQSTQSFLSVREAPNSRAEDSR